MGERHSIFSGASVERIEDALRDLVNFDQEGIPPDQLFASIRTALLPHLMRYNERGFQSHFNYTVEPTALKAAVLALEYNQNVTNWQVSPGGSTLEALCCRALCRILGMQPSAEATFMYAGTYANQEAIFLALRHFAKKRGIPLLEKGLQRYSGPRLVVAASPEFHRLSLVHAMRMLGLGEESIIYLPLDERYRVNPKGLRDALRSQPTDHEIFCVLCSAGTTQTGSVDPIQHLSEVCGEHDVWLHVDGAYGLPYRLVPELAHLFAGIELADSVSWDPHKQLAMPIPTSLLFLKRGSAFAPMAVHSNYFNEADAIGYNPGLKSPPTSRPMSALPLVAYLRSLGLREVTNRLRLPISAVSNCARWINTERDLALAVEPDLGILCIRLLREGMSEEALDTLHLRIQQRMVQSGIRTISKARLGGKWALRLVVISPEITTQDLQATIMHIRTIADEIAGGRSPEINATQAPTPIPSTPP